MDDDLNMMIMMIMLHDDYDDLLFFHENIFKERSSEIGCKVW